MSTRLTKPVTRVIEIDGKPMNVTLGVNGITFREYKRRTTYLLPYGPAIVRAVMLLVEQERREKAKTRKVKRGAL